MKLKITNPEGMAHTFYDVKSNEYRDGINYIELNDGTRFTVNVWNGWKIVVLD